ncbi:MAG: AraC family transcriptional regulator [Caulobacter sp.]|jgi:AraC-like DNA-binding protein|nr:AraC family transcriptional regulator [Caulobacter sp.]
MRLSIGPELDMTPGIKSMTAEFTVGAGFARGLLDFAVGKGADRDALLKAAGLEAAALEDVTHRLPFSGYVALMRAAKTATGDPALALHYGEQVDISKVSIVGLISQAAPDMIGGFTMLNRFVRLIVETRNGGNGERFQLVRDRKGIWVIDARLNPDVFPELTESALAQLVCGPRRHGQPDTLKEVHFTFPAPAYADEFERIFAVPVVFGSDRNGFLVDDRMLRLPVGLLPDYAGDLLTERAQAQLAQLDSSKSARGRVEAVLAPMVRAGQPGMDAVADALKISRQRLYRQLRAEGTSFEQVLDGLRHRLALEYLGEQKASVNETAYLLGFSDPAAFSRAFKRWTGASPKSVRDRLES